MDIYVNRILNLKKIKAIGLDMDHTLVRYNIHAFEKLTFETLLKKLVNELNYPKEVLQIQFDFNRTIKGLIIDKANGNVAKLSLYGRVKKAYHGLRPLDYQEIQQTYGGLLIDLNDPNYHCIDTSFSISETTLFQFLVDLKDNNPQLKIPDYELMANHVHTLLDQTHRDGKLKEYVVNNLKDFVIQESQCRLSIRKI